jgi:hypothetical protein
VPLALEAQSLEYPFIGEENHAVFPEFTDQGYEVEAVLSQYFVNNLIYQMHHNDLLIFDSGDGFSKLMPVFFFYVNGGGDWSGFQLHAPCKIIL